jgi:hypothetical protein
MVPDHSSARTLTVASVRVASLDESEVSLDEMTGALKPRSDRRAGHHHRLPQLQVH